jgi:hypothetical protein
MRRWPSPGSLCISSQGSHRQRMRVQRNRAEAIGPAARIMHTCCHLCVPRYHHGLASTPPKLVTAARRLRVLRWGRRR